MIKAVLFDMDGLLVDTETVGIDIATEICKTLGLDLTPDEQKGFVGITDRKFYEKLFERHHIHEDIDTILYRHFLIYEESLKTKLKAFPGATSLPKELKTEGFLLGLVSGSTRKQIHIVLDQLNIRNQFDVIIGEEDVVNGKPNPEGYLLASHKLHVEPNECLVLEDATSGIKAAKSAGMKVIAVRNNGGQDITLADVTVDNLTLVKLHI